MKIRHTQRLVFRTRCPTAQSKIPRGVKRARHGGYQQILAFVLVIIFVLALAFVLAPACGPDDILLTLLPGLTL